MKKRVKPSSKRILTEKYLGMDISEWRLKKRQEWRAVVVALKRFQYGSAYVPTNGDLYEIEKAADRITETLKSDWVCW